MSSHQVDELINYDLDNNPSFQVLNQEHRHALADGKRFRSIITLSILLYFNVPTTIYKVALVVEYLHNCSLIIDDLPTMDNDDVRRGKLSLHKLTSAKTAQLVAFNLNLVAQHHLATSITNLQINPVLQRDIYKELHNILLRKLDIVSGICNGQLLDIGELITDLGSYLKMAKGKTSSLFELSFIIGWVFGTSTTNNLEHVSQLGTTIGLAYQIYDDYNDYEEDVKYGRPNIFIITTIEIVNSLFREYLRQYRRILKLLNLDKLEYLNHIADYIESKYIID